MELACEAERVRVLPAQTCQATRLAKFLGFCPVSSARLALILGGDIGWSVSDSGPALDARKIWNKCHRTASHALTLSRRVSLILQETGHKPRIF